VSCYIYYTDYSEVGSLFLDPAYRGNGHWLAASRYLLMGQFPERFSTHVIAELRGTIDDSGQSPFWNAIGKNFFEMDYAEADAICGVGSNQFITELMPKHPIYTCLLNQEARDAIGAPNKQSCRALDFLQEEGYDYENVVDIFDGGPILRAKIDQIKSVRNIGRGLAKISDKDIFTDPTLVANTTLDNFRVAFSEISRGDQNTIELPAHVLDLLHVNEGDAVRLIQKQP